ncbi:13538_t:CDS:2 [Funneliformis geosporum]|uniref:13538_t:CDS:1 n=1 Tax=Funneliformis geosporum TaxID=1117311 RepID=A0A9W4SA13_9GLOM|nr:13538_t:CDS:2 [Funneliformis geosporum]
MIPISSHPISPRLNYLKGNFKTVLTYIYLSKLKVSNEEIENYFEETTAEPWKIDKKLKEKKEKFPGDSETKILENFFSILQKETDNIFEDEELRKSGEENFHLNSENIELKSEIEKFKAERDKKETDIIKKYRQENKLLKVQEVEFGKEKEETLHSEVEIEKAENKKLREQIALLNEYIGELGAEVEDYLNLQSRLTSAENILSEAEKKRRTRSNSLDLAYSPISPINSQAGPTAEWEKSRDEKELIVLPEKVRNQLIPKNEAKIRMIQIEQLVDEKNHDLLPLLRSVLINWAAHINSLLSELPEDVEEHRELVSENARLWEEIRTRGINSGSTTPNNETETSTDRGEKLPSPEPKLKSHSETAREEIGEALNEIELPKDLELLIKSTEIASEEELSNSEDEEFFSFLSDEQKEIIENTKELAKTLTVDSEKAKTEAVVGSVLPRSPHQVSVESLASSMNQIFAERERIFNLAIGNEEAKMDSGEIKDSFATLRENTNEEYKDVEEQIKEKNSKKAKIEKEIEEIIVKIEEQTKLVAELNKNIEDSVLTSEKENSEVELEKLDEEKNKAIENLN